MERYPGKRVLIWREKLPSTIVSTTDKDLTILSKTTEERKRQECRCEIEENPGSYISNY
jgi:hypothetical protein